MGRRGQRQLIETTLSEGLQREVVQHIPELELLDVVPWMAMSHGDSRLEVAKNFISLFWSPNETLRLIETMIIIRAGFIVAKGHVMSVGDAWNHDNILLESKH